MDLRKIQVTGGSSFMVTLPKDWADSIGLKKNDIVSLERQPDGSLLLCPEGRFEDGGSVKSIDVGGIADRGMLFRMLLGSYIAGFEYIELRSDGGLSSMAVSTASYFTQIAIGLAIVEESDDLIVVKSLTTSEQLKPSKSIERMKVLVRNMLRDIAEGVEKGDPSVFGGMSERDREVDRMHWFISRQVNMNQKNILLSKQSGMDLCELSRCNSISRFLERVGDHAVIMSELLEGVMGCPGIREAVPSICREVADLLCCSVATWIDKNLRNANACIERGAALVERTKSIGEAIGDARGDRAASVELVAGSMRRVAEYSIDISETAINSMMDSRS